MKIEGLELRSCIFEENLFKNLATKYFLQNLKYLVVEDCKGVDYLYEDIRGLLMDTRNHMKLEYLNIEGVSQ